VNAAYVDTSCLVAIAFAEPGYKAVASRLDRFDQLFASNLLEAELRAAFRREKVNADDTLLGSLSWVFPDRTLTAEIEAVLDAGQVRGADAWHLACALYLSPDPRELAFVTMDRRQARVAEALGFADRI
jgi:predicted nucleic acid-binding protein